VRKGKGCSAMTAPNEFWLNLHRLAESYQSEGLTPDERVKSILSQFKSMPPIAQRELLRDLACVIVHCPDLYPVVSTELNGTEASPVRFPKKAAG
jgi:hypothetical protein